MHIMLDTCKRAAIDHRCRRQQVVSPNVCPSVLLNACTGQTSCDPGNLGCAVRTLCTVMRTHDNHRSF